MNERSGDKQQQQIDAFEEIELWVGEYGHFRKAKEDQKAKEVFKRIKAAIRRLSSPSHEATTTDDASPFSLAERLKKEADKWSGTSCRSEEQFSLRDLLREAARMISQRLVASSATATLEKRDEALTRYVNEGLNLRNAIIEECAVVCDKGVAEQDDNLTREPGNQTIAGIRIGHLRDGGAIRALKSSVTTDGGFEGKT